MHGESVDQASPFIPLKSQEPPTMRLWITACLPLAMLSLQCLHAAEFDSALATIKQVGPQAKGAEAASAAWNELAQADAAQIPALLHAIDDGNPLAANYIRSAVEAIAQRQGSNLPVDGLMKFVASNENNPRARRFAYELLVRADPKAESQLLPQMLNDSSVEIRRDAVANRIAAAKGQQGRQQIETYQTAFDAAVDDDQVKEIAKALEGLGEEVDIARHYGFIMKWQIVGPFDNTDEKGFDQPHGPEGKPIDLSASYKGSHDAGEVKWQKVNSDDDYGRVDINKALAKHKNAICYAATTFESATAHPIELRFKSKNACKVWLNGKLVDEREVYHADGSPNMDQYRCTDELKKGTNTILVKVCQNDQDESWAQDWAFQMRACDSVGAAVLAENRD
jgi:hypothetical protein